jgi:hypothetical protein
MCILITVGIFEPVAWTNQKRKPSGGKTSLWQMFLPDHLYKGEGYSLLKRKTSPDALTMSRFVVYYVIEQSSRSHEFETMEEAEVFAESLLEIYGDDYLQCLTIEKQE